MYEFYFVFLAEYEQWFMDETEKKKTSRIELTERVWEHILALNQPEPAIQAIFEFLSDFVHDNGARLLPDYMSAFHTVPRTMLMLAVENEVIEDDLRHFVYKELIKSVGCSALCRTPVAKSVVCWFGKNVHA